MRNILTINVGSSSVKYDIFQGGKRTLSGIIEGIGGNAQHKYDGKRAKVKARTYKQAFSLLVSLFQKSGIHIDAVGHRVVHGGDITRTTKISESLLRKIKKLIPLAPLHNGPELRGILACRKVFKVPHYAVFDTSFHTSIPPVAATYAIPSSITKKYGIKRYGFHGINHKHIANEAARLLKKPLKSCKVITCHLGNGCSIAAIKKGRSIDTSMGFTPLEGLVMGTRCGDIDPSIQTFLMGKGYTSKKIDLLLNKKSGLLGISGVSSDMRTLMRSKRPSAKLAVDLFCYHIAKYIGAYLAVLNGADAIVFSAGIGEKATSVRAKIMNYLSFSGIKLDKKRNKANATTITTSRSKIKVFVIPANEALMIAKEVSRVHVKKK